MNTTLLVGINTKYIHTNLAIRYLRDVVKNDHEVEIVEYTLNHHREEIVSDLLSKKWDIIGFSCYLWNMELIESLLPVLKMMRPSAVIFLGGPEVSYHCEELLKRYQEVDYIISGEGEKPFQELLTFLEGDGNFPDMIYARDHQGSFYREKNLDSLPFPYGEKELSEERIFYYEFSRGCPYQCSYCLSSTTKGVSRKSLSQAIQEIFHFVEKKVPLVKLVDRTFNAHLESLALVEYLIDHGGETLFHFEICADLLTEKWIQVLAKAPKGRFQFEIGVQSIYSPTMQEISRVTQLEKLYKNVLTIQAMKTIPLHLDLIVGLPYEGYERFQEGFNKLFSLEVDAIQIGFLKVLKGSEMERKAESYQLKYRPYAPFEILENQWISYEEIQKLKWVEEGVERYYNSGKFPQVIGCWMKQFTSPFTAFEHLGEALKKHYHSNAHLTLQDSLELLNRSFYLSSPNKKEIEEFQRLLLIDYLSLGREKGRLLFLDNYQPSKREVVDFLDRNSVWREEKFPHYKMLSIENFIKQVCIYSIIKLNLVNDTSEAIEWLAFDYTSREKNQRAQYYFFIEK